MKDKMLKNIQRMQFYAVELNLYLDNFPNNSKAQEDYKEVSEKLDALIKDYEDKFGPLTNFGSSHIQNPSSWVNDPWPWEL